MGRDELVRVTERRKLTVSIHAPAWGATARLEGWRGFEEWFQSTRPHGARHRMPPSADRWKVSIHAPAWGATAARVGDRRRGRCVSIHAPAWGATFLLGFFACFFKCFNPRARMGRDLADDEAEANGDVVSIHAPAWGATYGLDDPRRVRAVSIHAPAWGAT